MLTFRQKELLFYGWASLPRTEDIHKANYSSIAAHIGKHEQEALSRAGYSPEQIAKIEAELKKAGINA
jgi:hypothetical protein